MAKKSFCFSAIIIVGITFIYQVAFGAAGFYKGKAIRIIVGYSPGGGFDIYARTIARHFGKHIPGNPAIVVENMPGAGGLIAANHLYNLAEPDGLTLCHFSGSLFFNQVLGRPGIEFDARKFGYVGAPIMSQIVYVLSKRSGVPNLKSWMTSKTPIKLGGTAPGSATDNGIRILKSALGVPIKLISGYKGIADIRLAMERGELNGSAGGWYGLKVSWRKVLESGSVVVVAQAVPKPLPDLPNVPLVINFAKTDEARQLIEEGIHNVGIISWPFVLPPGTPRDRVEILRKAFIETLKDNELLAEAKKANLHIEPVSGDELETKVARLFKLDPSFLVKLNEILFK
jgi:tripartite-type tricarboxylate transporter receptor subunit TctC